MKKTGTLLLLALTGLFVSAFRKSPLMITPGTYGVCDCENNNSTPPMILLDLREDNTFHYIDNTNPSKKLDLNGTWTNKGNKIVLKNTASFSIHDEWKPAGNADCIRSKNGMNFRRLCRIKGCK